MTTGGEAELTWQAVVVLERARGPLELLFRLWKSHKKLAKHRASATALEVLAVFYAKLLGILLQHGIWLATAWHTHRRSLVKAARALADMVKEILLTLRHGAALEAALLRLRDLIEKLGGTTDRIKEPSHTQLIEDPELLDWSCP